MNENKILSIIGYLIKSVDADKSDYENYEHVMNIWNKTKWTRKDFKDHRRKYYFSSTLKNSQPDHLAKAIMILRTLCESLDYDIEYDEDFSEYSVRSDLSYNILLIIFALESDLQISYHSLLHLCKHNKIDIERFIKARIKYQEGER